jgi:hypothetical protein
MTFCASGQIKFGTSVDSLCRDAKKHERYDGEELKNKLFYKYFAVLIRDTCDHMNRFTNCYIQRTDSCTGNFYCPAVLIDSNTAQRVEVFLKEWIDTAKRSVQIRFTNTKKHSFYKYIRLYGGFINEIGDTFIVVQLVTKREFYRNPLYKRQFDLFATRTTSKLRFMILKISGDRIFIHSSFL